MAWKFVSCACFVCCVGSGHCDEPIIRLEESFRARARVCVCVCELCDLETSTASPLGYIWAVALLKIYYTSLMSLL